MINTIRMSLKIDLNSSINGVIYYLRKLPILHDLFTDSVYKSKVLKFFIRIFVYIIALFKMILYRFLYFYIIYVISHTISKGNEGLAFVHIFFVCSLLGLFINNKLLGVSRSKYYSIVVFNMDAEMFMKSSLWFDIIKSLILNIIGFIIVSSFYVEIPVATIVLLCGTSILTRVVGEGWELDFYKKHGYRWMDKTIYYFILCGLFIGTSLLPYFGFYLLDGFIFVTFLFLFFVSILSINYLYKTHDFKLIFKRLNTKTRIMNLEENKAYSRQAMVEVKNKDKIISNKKIKNKKGYDLFNTIFFERHKEILMRSCYRFSLILVGIYVVFLFFLFNGNLNDNINSFLLTHLGFFVIIMYFINRGAIVTQAMFFNCDHAMLSYNFYREPRVILGLFRKRLIMLIKINLLPALVISIGNSLLLYFSGGADIYTYIGMFLYIIFLSIFFSVHYMVLYYLLQPYNKNFQIRKFSYTIISFLTYFVSYMFTDFIMGSLLFSIYTIIFTIIYVIIGCILVYKYSPRTFKINL